MQTITESTKQALLDRVCKMFAYLYVYKKWPGRIYSTASDEVVVIGDCSDFISANDEIIVGSSSDLNVDWTVDTSVFNGTTGRTTLAITGLGDVGINLPNKDFIYKKIDLTEFLTDDGIGDLRKLFETNAFGTIRPSQLNLSLLDDNDEYVLTGTKLNPGCCFKDTFVSEVVAVESDGNFTKITTLEHTTQVYDSSLFLDNILTVVDGKAKNFSSKIVKVSKIGKYFWIYDDISDDLSVGDKICVNMQPKFLVKMKFCLKGHTADIINMFFGVVYSKNITKAIKRLDMIAYGLIKDCDEQFAFQVSNETDIMPKISGVKLIGYDLGAKSYEEEKLVKVGYKYPSGNLQGVTGVSIKKASSDTGTGPRLLVYRKPNMFQWDNGDWTELDEEADDETLTAADSSTITIDVRPSDYPQKDAEEIVFMDVKSKMDISVLDSGPVGLRVDEGEYSQILTRFNRIWVDETYSVGTLNDEVDMTDISNDDRPEIIPNTAGAWAVYFCSVQRFSGIKITGLQEKGNQLSDLIWEYSLSYGTDPACFDTLTVVSDGTDGFTKDGTILWDMPDDFQAKSKIGVSTDFHMFCVRVRKATSVGCTKTVDKIVPLITCTGKDGDIFIFDCDYKNLMNKDIDDDLIVKYNNDGGELVLATWKQCVRVIDVIDDLIDKSGFGKNKSVDDALLSFNKPLLNIWGKPFISEQRIPTALCKGTGLCNGYVFACFKNAIYRLKGSEYEWELLFECHSDFTLHTIHYFNKMPEIPGYKYYVLALGYKDVVPPNSFDEDDWYIQPEQILVRIDDVDGDSYSATKLITSNGGNISSQDSYTDGDGLIDTRVLIRAGAHFEETVFGLLNMGDIGSLTNEDIYSEHVCIPFEQLILRLNGVISYAAGVNHRDLEFDIIGLLTEKAGWDISLDAQTPIYLNPGFYYIHCIYGSAADPLWSDLGFRYTLGQDGGNCNVFFPGENEGDGYNGIWGQRPNKDYALWGWRSRVFGFQNLRKNVAYIYNGNRAGTGLFPESSYGTPTAAKFFARTLLLSAAQLTPDLTNEYADHVVQSVYLDFYQLQDNDKPNEKRLEITTPREKLTAGLLTNNMVIWHYDNSTSTWNNLGTTMPINVTLDYLDKLVIADNWKFTRFYIETDNISGAINFEQSLSDGAGGFFTTGGQDDITAGAGAARIGIIDCPMERIWFKDNLAGASITNKYIWQIQQTVSGASVRVTNIAPTRRSIWDSLHSDYWSGATKLNDFVPIEIIYNEYDDSIYGCVLDQLDMTYHIFCFYTIATRKTDSSTTNYLKTTQIDDPEMQPVGFCFNDDTGDIYFVATDRKYRRKTAQLWKVSYDSGTNIWTKEKQVDIKPGEWDCPTKLICVNGNVYGFTAPNYNYFWEWSNNFYLRIPIANFSNKKISEALDSTTQLINKIVLIDENAKTWLRKRIDENPSVDSEWFGDDIINIEFIRTSKSKVSGVLVSWNDEMNNLNGEVKVGTINNNEEYLSITNELITYPELAYMVGFIAWNFFVKDRSEIEGTCVFLPQHQLFDVIKLYINTNKRFSDLNIDDWRRWQLISFTLSWKRKNARFELLESDKEVSGES